MTEDYQKGYSECYQGFVHVMDDMTREMVSAKSTVGLQNAVNMFISHMHSANTDTRFKTI